VHERLTIENISGNIRREDRFKEDHDLPEHLRSTLDDYRGSGYDRGHLAAAANHRDSRRAMNLTFLMSNMSPQVGKGFNRGAWKQLEERVRKIVEKNLSVHVVSGPLYLASGSKYERGVSYRVIGRRDVAVPTHFFKVVLIEKRPGYYQREAYVLPNSSDAKDKPLNDYQLSIHRVEELSGLVFR